MSTDLLTITQPTLADQTYIWNQTAGSYNIPTFSVSSTQSICNASDIFYTMTSIGSASGSTAFITFDSTSMLVNWFESAIRVNETFTVNLTAGITNMNGTFT